MGHCYEASTGSMICDRCSEPGARTRRCAFGYCPGADLCKPCWTIEKPGWRRLHKANHCEEAHERFVADLNREKELLEAGELLRIAAVGTVAGVVRVTFKDRTGRTVDHEMSTECYRSFPLLRPTTLREYQEVRK